MPKTKKSRGSPSPLYKVSIIQRLRADSPSAPLHRLLSLHAVCAYNPGKCCLDLWLRVSRYDGLISTRMVEMSADSSERSPVRILSLPGLSSRNRCRRHSDLRFGLRWSLPTRPATTNGTADALSPHPVPTIGMADGPLSPVRRYERAKIRALVVIEIDPKNMVGIDVMSDVSTKTDRPKSQYHLSHGIATRTVFSALA